MSISIALAPDPLEVTVPPDLADVLDDDDRARRAFAALSYGQQMWLVLGIERARPDARGPRIERAVARLHQLAA
jgi:uncharacterized protein YdeI (YjbR/CyaY-like superfamily)